MNYGKPRKRPFARIAFSRSFGLAIELPFVVVGWVAVAAGIGYLLDRWLHTWPVLTLVLGLVGFASGIWDLVRRLGADESKPKGLNGG